MKTKTVYIKGMHCVSCEKLLDDEFRAVSGVKDVKVDRKANTAEIFFADQEPRFEDLKAVAKKYGYDVFEKNPEKTVAESFNWKEWAEAIFVVLGLWVVFRIFQNLGYIDKIDLRGENISFGVSILIGLVASVSSCLAVVGAVVIAFGEKYQSEGGSFFESAVKPNLYFHIGRLITFFVLGGLLGMIGGELNISGNFISIFTIIIALVMGWLGLNILGVLPSISNMGVKMPSKLTSKWSNLKNSEHSMAPFLLGGMSSFLPCGFTQSMQIFALTSGSFWTGGISLLLFALGTVPSLMLLGITASWTKNRKIGVFQKVAGVLILVFAFYMFQSGLALKGVKADVIGSNNDQETRNKPDEKIANKDEQVVEMHVTSRGFEPKSFKIKKGVPVKWVIKGDQVTSCTNKIIVPSLNISKSISYGENIVKFTPDKTGTIPFSCWMGMVRGSFVVVE